MSLLALASCWRRVRSISAKGALSCRLGAEGTGRGSILRRGHCVSREAHRLKILIWDSSGLVLVWKQLQQGSFRWPPMDGVMKLSPIEFAALFDGLDWTRVQSAKGILKPSVAAVGFVALDSPRDDMQSLPEGIDALRALVLTMMSERNALALERDTLQTQNDRLRHLLLQLRRLHFGPRSERLPEEQLQLGLEASSRRSPKPMPRRRSAIPNCARTMPPNGVPAAAHCRRTCRGSR
jgi:hypothetical protein